MAYNGDSRGGLVSAGGVLSIVGGISQLVSLPAYFLANIADVEMLFLPFLPYDWRGELLWSGRVILFSFNDVLIWPLIIVGLLLVLGILAVVGGVSAIRRKRFGLSLAGAICALLSGLLGILAVIFIALGKRDFEALRG